MICDLHVELIFLYNKISVRLLEFDDTTTFGNYLFKKNKHKYIKIVRLLDATASFEKNFEQLLKECKKNKISQSLLYLSKALYFTGSQSDKYSKQQKELVEVRFLINFSPRV